MIRFALLFFALPLAAAEPTHQVKLNGHTFTLPKGFTVELVASSPLIERPVHADFDDLGRLYVVDHSGSNDNAEIQNKTLPNRIVRLADKDGDGKFETMNVYADKMMFLEGMLWHAGSIYTAGPPSIWKLTDKDGDGVADERVEWQKRGTLTGCANDLHGPYLGPDGWIYWTKGAFAEQEIEMPGFGKRKSKAAHIFRARPDGTGVEPVMTGGMDNPVELVFTPGGERIFSTTFFQHPAEGRRDGLVHAVYGAVYGKDHAVLDGHPRTGPDLMPPMTHMGAAAPSGLMRMESNFWGDEYKDNLFCAQFNLHKISRHILVPDGATFKTIDSDLLVSDNFDFHPTDVLEDADGSLIVLDTGGWYKMCCPTSQMAKPDIKGAIYRIRKTGAKRVEDPRGMKIKWGSVQNDDLPRYLSDPRPAVQKVAMNIIAGRKDKVRLSIPFLDENKSPQRTLNSIWLDCWVPDQFSDRLFIDLWEFKLKEINNTSRLALLNSLHARNLTKAPQIARLLLTDKSPHVQRAAIEVVGRFKDHAAVSDLLAIARWDNDRTTDNSIIYALMQIGDDDELLNALGSTYPSQRRVSLIALDQLDKSAEIKNHVIKSLSDPDAKLRATAWWIAGRHPEWGDDVAKVVRERMKESPIPDALDLETRLISLASSKAIQAVLAENDLTPEAEILALRVMAKAHLKTTPEAWLNFALRSLFQHEDAKPMALDALRAMRLSGAQAQKLSANLRKKADDLKPSLDGYTLLDHVPGGMKSLSPEWFEPLRKALLKDAEHKERALAVSIFAKSSLKPEQLVELASMLKPLGVIEIDRLLDTFANETEPKVHDALLTALETSTKKTSLRIDRLKPVFVKANQEMQARAEKLYLAINADLEKQKQKLDEILPKLKDGDERRGQAIFKSAKNACSACHAVGYGGGTIGPDLSKIGGIRTERDLLESILFPSASFVRSYEPVTVTLASGASHNGNIKSETANEIVLTLAADKTLTIPRADIEEIKPGKVSVMPAGLDQQLSTQDMADLIAFLKSRK